MSGAAMGPGREFDLIRRLVRGWGHRATGIGDDAALLRVPPGTQLVATVDAAVDGVHFRRDWCTPEEIGYRATIAAVSDLAAMGAAPLGLLVALALPDEAVPVAERLARGIGEAAAACDAVIVGGNVTRATELSVSTTALGHVERPLTRDGARPGQTLYLTGRLGGPAAAVQAWSAGEAPRPAWRTRYVHPAARIREARWLAERGATAAIDLSDGLLADATHLAHASSMRLELVLDATPVVEGVTIATAARGGDEYELLVAAPDGLDAQAFEAEFALPLTRIGHVRGGAPEVHATLAGDRVAAGGGWDHLS